MSLIKFYRKKAVTHRDQKGFSVVEVLVATTILLVTITGTSALQSQVLQTSRQTNDRSFASQKATQMFEELRSFVEANRERPLKSLQDYYSNGANQYVPTLTIEKREDPVAPNNRRRDLFLEPDDPLSGNQRVNGHWKYVRQVTVEPVPSDLNARHVTVKVWYAAKDGSGQPESTSPLAVVTGILKTNIDQSPPTQVYDLFLVALDNSPGWWVEIASLRPIFDRTVDDLMSRNPGLEFRKRFISRVSYGRDPLYTPYMNTDADARDKNTPFVYSYVGDISESTSKSTVKDLFVYDLMQGRIRSDSTLRDGSTAVQYTAFKTTDAVAPNTVYTSQKPYREYAYADQYNHAMRYPEEIAAYNRLNAKYMTTPNAEPYGLEPSWRMLIEGMNTSPDIYRNSILINMHGELLPLVPMRNYADPAKVPCDDTFGSVNNPCWNPVAALSGNPDVGELRYRNMRVVTHPENIAYGNNDDIRLRVYAYETVPLGASGLVQWPASNNYNSVAFAESMEHSRVEKISLFMPFDGRGLNPENPAAPGFLNRPNALTFDPTTVLNALNIEKIVGTARVPYERFAKDSSFPNRPFSQLTYSDMLVDVSGISDATVRNTWVSALDRLQPIAFYEGTTRLLDARQVQAGNNVVAGLPVSDQPYLPDPDNADISRIIGLNTANRWVDVQVRFDTGTNTTNDSLTTTQETALRDLIDRQVVIDAGRVVNSAGEVIAESPVFARVRNIEINPSSSIRGVVRLYLYDDIPNTVDVGDVVVKHRDFDVVVSPQTLFEQDTPGILINLYDTPTRATSCGSISGLACLAGADTGLRSENRLYGQEYIPAPVTGFDFSQDLTNSGNRVKNTARWVVTLKNSGANSFNFASSEIDNRMLTFETRIGRARNIDQLRSNQNLLEQGMGADGSIYQPDLLSTSSVNEHETTMRRNLYNVSRTYVWTGAADIPFSEKFQFMGDPRFMPYADLKAQQAYNPFFVDDTSLRTTGHNSTVSSSSYTNYTPDMTNGQLASNSTTDVDFIRYSRWIVDGLMQSNSIYNSISGYSNYYFALGGEVAAGDNNGTFSVNKQAFTEGDDSGSVTNRNATVAVVSNGSDGQTKLPASDRPSGASARWMGLVWNGELFPDEDYGFWRFNGNLPTRGFQSSYNSCPSSFSNATSCARSGGGASVRQSYWQANTNSSSLPYNIPVVRRNTKTFGAPTFVNGNSTGSGSNNFNHNGNGSSGSLTNILGAELNRAFNLALESAPSANRPFAIDKNESSPYSYNNTLMSAFRNKTSYVDFNTGNIESTADQDNVYYTHSGGLAASAIMKVERSDAGAGYLLYNGLSPVGTSSEVTLARFSVAGMLMGYMSNGDVGTSGDPVGDSPDRIRPVPRLAIIEPTSAEIYEDMNSITVELKAQWLRWDEQKYANSYDDSWYDVLKVGFIPKVSDDNGKTWRHLDGTPAQAGVFNGNKLLSVSGSDRFDIPSDPGLTLNFPWNTSALNGTYLVRVEAYRFDNVSDIDPLPNGFAYHQTYVTLRRN